MRRGVQRILNMLMSGAAGAFVGSAAWRYWDFKKRPDIYEIWSAPWYTSVWITGIELAAFALICAAAKLVISRKYRIKEYD